ncbi:hypothetical protein HK100_011215 [Physocladia obscura]|uniref:Uncharacterized protein n=1 Tax=Physocladia obscura TaxID=109957 RepID=A0AAD5XEA5_9FUNG|nr:hypothetical protein HK100_011215 [Physocladia obscura]
MSSKTRPAIELHFENTINDTQNYATANARRGYSFAGSAFRTGAHADHATAAPIMVLLPISENQKPNQISLPKLIPSPSISPASVIQKPSFRILQGSVSLTPPQPSHDLQDPAAIVSVSVVLYCGAEPLPLDRKAFQNEIQVMDPENIPQTMRLLHANPLVQRSILLLSKRMSLSELV